MNHCWAGGRPCWSPSLYGGKKYIFTFCLRSCSCKDLSSIVSWTDFFLKHPPLTTVLGCVGDGRVSQKWLLTPESSWPRGETGWYQDRHGWRHRTGTHPNRWDPEWALELVIKDELKRDFQQRKGGTALGRRRCKLKTRTSWHVFFSVCIFFKRGNLVAQTVKNLPAMQETWVLSLDWKDPLEKGMAPHSSAWRILRTEEPCRLQSMGSQRVVHNWATKTQAVAKVLPGTQLLALLPKGLVEHWLNLSFLWRPVTDEAPCVSGT